MGTIVILIFVPVLVGLLLIISPIIGLSPLGQYAKYNDKISSYECGFTAVPGQTRSNLTITFYIVAILYLVFDLEIALLIPVVSNFYALSSISYSVVILFIIILTVGFVYELGSGAINWSNIGSKTP